MCLHIFRFQARIHRNKSILNREESLFALGGQHMIRRRTMGCSIIRMPMIVLLVTMTFMFCTAVSTGELSALYNESTWTNATSSITPGPPPRPPNSHVVPTCHGCTCTTNFSDGQKQKSCPCTCGEASSSWTQRSWILGCCAALLLLCCCLCCCVAPTDDNTSIALNNVSDHSLVTAAVISNCVLFDEAV